MSHFKSFALNLHEGLSALEKIPTWYDIFETQIITVSFYRYLSKLEVKTKTLDLQIISEFFFIISY
jgi:hypothetical protein